MERWKNSMDALLTLLPILLLKWKQTDAATVCFVVWTFIFIYYSLTLESNKPSKSDIPIHTSLITAFTLAAYVFAALDTRFLHISDNIPLPIRYKYAITYSFIILIKITLSELLFNVNNPLRLLFHWLNSKKFFIGVTVPIMLTRQIIVTLIHISTITGMIIGQIALNSKASIAIIIPAACLVLFDIVRDNFIYKDAESNFG